jgi:hypothetical protein
VDFELPEFATGYSRTAKLTFSLTHFLMTNFGLTDLKCPRAVARPFVHTATSRGLDERFNLRFVRPTLLTFTRLVNSFRGVGARELVREAQGREANSCVKLITPDGLKSLRFKI